MVALGHNKLIIRNLNYQPTRVTCCELTEMDNKHDDDSKLSEIKLDSIKQ